MPLPLAFCFPLSAASFETASGEEGWRAERRGGLTGGGSHDPHRIAKLRTPCASLRRGPFGLVVVGPPAQIGHEWTLLPLGVRGSVEAGGRAFGEDVKHVLAASALRVGVVLLGARSPIGFAGHRVDWNLAEEPVLGVGVPPDRYALHQGLEVGRISKGIRFYRDHAAVGKVLVAVDGFAHHAQIAAEVRFPSTLN